MCVAALFPGFQPPSSQVIRETLHAAVQMVLDQDYDLIALGAHEQAIAHRIAVYLEKSFPRFNTDCEYNRKKHKTKAYSKEGGEEKKGMRPDIIVHRRNTDDNILAVEMKANANSDTSGDVIKLKALQTHEEGYCYREVAFIRIKNSLPDIGNGVLEAYIEWFDDEHKPSPPFIVTNDQHKQAVVAIAKLRLSEQNQ